MTPIEHWRTIDKYRNVMPWYTRPCLEWLNKLDLTGKNVFEYGVGMSSIWYRSRGCYVYGVDTDKNWITDWALQKVENEAVKYLTHIHILKQEFDLVIIDGDFRDRCARHVFDGCLKKGGYLIADNFEQPSADLADWPKTRELTKHLPLTIYKEPEHIDWQTAVFHNV